MQKSHARTKESTYIIRAKKINTKTKSKSSRDKDSRRGGSRSQCYNTCILPLSIHQKGIIEERRGDDSKNNEQQLSHGHRIEQIKGLIEHSFSHLHAHAFACKSTCSCILSTQLSTCKATSFVHVSQPNLLSHLSLDGNNTQEKQSYKHT